MKKNAALILAVLLVSRILAADVTVKLFADMRLSSVLISVASGSYKVTADGKEIPVSPEASVFQINVVHDSIEVRIPGDTLGRFKTFALDHNDTNALFKIKPLMPQSGTRTYHDALRISLRDGALFCVSTVMLEDYVGGVVEAESGGKTIPEYYKVQAILCRTYALNNLNRHTADGYELCDGVHCQVYKGRTQDKDIQAAVDATQSLVLVDNNVNLITAAFHSNCGGQTVNSEDVWISTVPYLRSVKDTFCLRMPHARWTRKIATDDWLSYLQVKCKVELKDSLAKINAQQFTQDTRMRNFTGGKPALSTVRADWLLRSTFFSVEPAKDSVILRGRGYGHGVGLCQEGAMRMAKLGYSYDKVLRFYYKGINIVNMNKLAFFREEDE